MDYKMVIPVLVSFALSVIMGPVVIPILRKLKMGQTEREEGVAVTLKESGDATMGGVIILASIVLTSLIYIKDYPKVIPILFVTLGFGMIGFLDDYLKVVMRRSDGLYPKQKMALQILVTGIFAYYIVRFTDVPLTWLIPFSEGKYLDWGIFCASAFVCCSDWNGQWSEFHRRMDGLASSVTVLVATFLQLWQLEQKAGLNRLLVQSWARCLDFCCSMYIRRVCLWGIQVLLRLGALSHRRLICCRCRFL